MRVCEMTTAPMPATLPSLRTLRCLSTALALVMGLTACANPQTSQFQHEEFNSSTTYSRTFQASEPRTCEAARRALLSQGYVVISVTAENVNARKSFQPTAENHIEIEFRVVCTREARGSGTTLAFVSALQDRYALKKSNNSASVGVGAFGSLSVPFTGSDDSLVKVASETITAATFYDRFFKLLTRYLVTELDEPEVPQVLGPVPGAAPTPKPPVVVAPAMPQAAVPTLPASAPAPEPSASSAGVVEPR